MDGNQNGFRAALRDYRLWIILCSIVGHAAISWYRLDKLEEATCSVQGSLNVVVVQQAEARVERAHMLDRIKELNAEVKRHHP